MKIHMSKPTKSILMIFPDGTTLYHLVGSRFVGFNDPTPRVSFSAVELMNIYVGCNESLTGKFTRYSNTNWDPWGRQLVHDFFTATWPEDIPFSIPLPPLPGPLPVF